MAALDDQPREPRRGLLGCGGREIWLAEGSCAGARVLTCWLETEWDRDDPRDPRAYLYDSIDASHGCERVRAGEGVVVACLDKNDDGDTLDAGESASTLGLP